MGLETKGRNLILIDRGDVLKQKKLIDSRERKISGPVRKLWEEMSSVITVESTGKALEINNVPPEWSESWERMIREFVRDSVIPEWINSMRSAGDLIAQRVNQIQKKQYSFDSTDRMVKAWVDASGGKLIVELTKAQYNSIHALLQDQIALGVTSPYMLAQRVKVMVGLTEREGKAVTRFLNSLAEEGVPAPAINKKVARYADFLHKNRAARIARTELSDAYNFGQLNSIKQAQEAGELPGEVEKSWMAGGADPCEICLENEGVGWIPVDAAFPSGDEHPTAHPHCECSLSYRVKR